MSQSESQEKENIWNKILAKSTTRNKTKDANILVLGDKRSGKEALMNAVQKLNPNTKKMKLVHEGKARSSRPKNQANMIDYTFYSVMDPEDDSVELGKINLWFLEETLHSKEILDVMLKKEVFSNFMVLVVLDLEEYWKLSSKLTKWIEFINTEIVPRFCNKLSLTEGDLQRSKLKDRVLSFMEPETTPEGRTVNSKPHIGMENSLNLPNGVLESNPGFPIGLSMNNAEHIIEIRKQSSGDRILEMIEYTLRKTAVTYAASLFYTSIKMETNINVLGDYLNHLLLEMPFIYPSNTRKDQVFIPTGYDNLDLINQIYSRIVNKAFESVVAAPLNRLSKRKLRKVVVQDNQAFLREINQRLNPQNRNLAAPRFNAERAARILNLLQND